MSSPQSSVEIDINSLGIPVNVEQVLVDPLQRTKPYVFEPHVKAIKNAKNYGDLLAASHQAIQNMNALGAFKNVDMRLEILSEGPEQQKNVAIRIQAEEKGLYYGSVQATTRTDATQVSTDVTVGVRNALGYAETFTATGTATGSQSGFFNRVGLGAKLPQFLGEVNRSLSASFKYGPDVPPRKYHRYALDVTEGSVELSQGNATLSYSVQKRNMHDVAADMPMALYQEAGSSLKSSVRLTHRVDNRDDRALPTNGESRALTVEYAGIGGDTHHVKGHAEMESHYPLFKNISVGWGLTLGAIYPIHGRQSVPFSERFFLESSVLRGFGRQSMGPVAGPNKVPIGGNVMGAAQCALSFPFPFSKDLASRFSDSLRMHVFANAANLVNMAPGQFNSYYFDRLLREMRLSVGTGFVFNFGMFKAEMNYAIPVGQKEDVKAKPFQLVLRMQYNS